MDFSLTNHFPIVLSGEVKLYTTDAVHGASLGEPNLTIFLL